MRATHLGRSIAIGIAIGVATPAIAENSANAALDSPFTTSPAASVTIATPASAEERQRNRATVRGSARDTRGMNPERGAPVTPPDRIVP